VILIWIANAMNLTHVYQELFYSGSVTGMHDINFHYDYDELDNCSKLFI